MPSTGEILIVDDSVDDVQLLLRSFRQLGIQNRVKVCSGGADALHYLLEECDALPVLMLLDLKMPGTDGFHVLSKVKSDSDLREMIVIVLTTSADVGDIRLSYELGANSFLTKPLDLAEFREMVAAFHQYWVVNNQAVPKTGRLIPKPDELSSGSEKIPAA